MKVLPARAGVILTNTTYSTIPIGTTRTSGGDPTSTPSLNALIKYYPHERG